MDCELHFLSTAGEIRTITKDTEPLALEYTNSVEQFRESKYRDSLRTLRVCCEKLGKMVFADAFPEKSVPDSNGSVKALRKETEEMNNNYTMIGEMLSTTYHLCCKASHDDPYAIEEEDTAVAHHLFRRSVQLYQRRLQC